MNDYDEKIKKLYRERESHLLMTKKEMPTVTEIRNACYNVISDKESLSKNDTFILKRYFEKEVSQLTKKDIENKKDSFKTIIRFLKNETQPTNRYVIDLLALLIDFKPRPFDYKNISSDFDTLKTTDDSQNDLLVQQLTAFFIGREFLFEVVNNFIKTNQRGYFYLFGNPGIGKSAFAVNYSQSKESVLHIIRHSDNSKNKTRHFLKNVINQLQQKYDLPISNYPENYTDDGAFLYEILERVSSLLFKNQKLIIVVDGIDELEDLTFFRRKNILNLPSLLPTGIFFLLTMRDIKKQIRLPYNNGKTQEYILENDSKNNKEDIAKFLQLKVKDENIQTYLTKHGVKETDFVTDLECKSEGNFMYLTHVLREIENGFYQDTTLNQLPTGLEGYYRDHWERMMQDVSEIDKEIKAKVIYILSDMGTPVTVDYLTDIISHHMPEEKISAWKIQTILNEWKQFLNSNADEDGDKVHSFYHKSFIDFLKNEDTIKAAGIDYKKVNRWILDYYEKDYVNEKGEVSVADFMKEFLDEEE